MNLFHWVSRLSHSEKGKPRKIESWGNMDIEITKVVTMASEAVPGSLFVAMKGPQFDGHDFIQEAIKRGASAILMDQTPLKNDLMTRMKKADEDTPVSFIRVENTRQALETLVPVFYGYPADKLHLVGITGTNGKTTTAMLVDKLLHAHGHKTALLSTIAYYLGNEKKTAVNTTPGLLELHRLFMKMTEKGISHVTMEVSSHGLDQGRVAGCRFDCAVFTNLTQDHLDYHHTMDAYFTAKKRLFEQVSGFAVINVDDPWGASLRERISCKSWGYGIEQKKEIWPSHLSSTIDGVRMEVETPIGQIEISSPLVGRYNAYNLLAAIGAGISMGLSRETISTGIASLTAIPGRFEKIDMGQNFTVIVDYAHTPDALLRLLQAVKSLSPTRVITLFGCGGDRDREKRAKMGKVAANQSDIVILTSDNPRHEPPLKIIKEIEEGFEGLDQETFGHESIPDRRSAIDRAIAMALPGDVVVIGGKGHESEQTVGKKKTSFDDREVVRQVLVKYK